MRAYFVAWIIIMLLGVLIIVIQEDDFGRKRIIEHNVCAKGHCLSTRFRFVGELWWIKHEKCFDNTYRRL